MSAIWADKDAVGGSTTTAPVIRPLRARAVGKGQMQGVAENASPSRQQVAPAGRARRRSPVAAIGQPGDTAWDQGTMGLGKADLAKQIGQRGPVAGSG